MNKEKKEAKKTLSLVTFFFPQKEARSAIALIIFFLFLPIQTFRARAPASFLREQTKQNAQRAPPRERALHGGDDHSRARGDPRGALGLEALVGAVCRTDAIGIDVDIKQRQPAHRRLRLCLGGPLPAHGPALDLPRRRPRLASTPREGRPPSLVALEREAGLRVGLGAGVNNRRAALGRCALFDRRVVEGGRADRGPRPQARLPLRADGSRKCRRIPGGSDELDGRVADDPSSGFAEEREPHVCGGDDADRVL